MSQATRSSHLTRPVLIFLGLSLALSGTVAAQCLSTGVGNFHTNGAWTNCNLTFPQPTDTARIQPTHVVPALLDVVVDSLEIEPSGELVMTGYPLEIRVQNLHVQPTAILHSTAGSNVYITSQFGTGLLVVNEGTIRAGDGIPTPFSGGADVFIHDGGPGGDLPCPQASMILGTGGASFEGEHNGGNVYMLAETIDLDNTTVRGGSGDPAFDILCRSVAGSVYIAGVNVSLTGGTVVEQGINGGGAAVPGWCTSTTVLDGSVKVVGQSCNTGLGTVIVDCSTVGHPASNQCATIFATTTILNKGVVYSGGAGCIYWDPPDLAIAGDSELAAGDILIAGENLDASGLASRTLPTPAISADTLEIRLEPGGYLDLTGLTPGFDYFSAATSITLCGDRDRILTDPGVELAELMRPAPRVEPPKSTFVVSLNPGYQSLVTPGSSVEVPVQATSLSTGSAPVTLYVEDSAGWLTGGTVSVAANLDPGAAILRTLTIDVPSTAAAGDYTIVKASAEIAGQPGETTITIFEVAKAPCEGRGCKGKGGRGKR